ncbi:MAG: hypothetical protein J2O49_00215 [Sciscionella sp.]|nr:hypothetical protein [Sciscionella sp.]
MTDQQPVSCTQCGRVRDERGSAIDALAWMTERDRPGDAPRWLCPRCARAHVRDIEGKLPSEYW